MAAFPFVFQNQYLPFVCKIQRHILRDRRPSTAACPVCWAIWTKIVKDIEIVYGEGHTRAAKSEEKILETAR